jgi:HlyD family secretion protein
MNLHWLMPASLAPVAAVTLGLAACTAPGDDAALSGYAEAELVYLAPGSAGNLQTLNVQRGDSVKQGQLLYTLDADAESLGRDAAQARNERARAQADNLRKGRRPLELQALDQQIAQAQRRAGHVHHDAGAQPPAGQPGVPGALRLDEFVAAARPRCRAAARTAGAACAGPGFAQRRGRGRRRRITRHAGRPGLARWREGQRSAPRPPTPPCST